VPLSAFGALSAMYFSGVTINIYTEIGLLTLIGLITKHGILIVDCTLNFFKQGKKYEESILLAVQQRLRPILMTTVAMMGGALPLILAQGAGSNSRFDLGITIFFGMLVGTIFTLFIMPIGLLLLAKKIDYFS
jgi:multidrug efflux pump